MRYVPPDGYYWENLSLGFLVENHNKYHVGIDLHQEEGKNREGMAAFLQKRQPVWRGK